MITVDKPTLNTAAGTLDTVSSTTFAVTTTLAALASTFVTLKVGWVAAATLVSVTDNSGNGYSWSKIGTTVNPSTNVYEENWGVYATNGLASGTIVTITFSVAVSYKWAGMSSWNGILSTGAVDVTNTAIASNEHQNWVGANVTPTAGERLIIAYAESGGGGGDASSIPTSPWLELHDRASGANWNQTTVYQIVNADGTTSYTPGGAWSVSQTSTAGYNTFVLKAAPASPQKSRPMRDIANPGAWTREDGATTNLVGGINEATIDDATYIQSPANPANPAIERNKLSPANPPAAGNQIFKTRYKQDSAGTGTLNLKHRLYQGGGNTVGAGTLVVERTFLNVPLGITEEDYVLSGAEVALITDRGELYDELEAYKT